MIFYLILFVFFISGLLWLGQWVLANPGVTTITWGTWGLEMKTATLVLGIALGFAVFYLVIAVLRRILGLPRLFDNFLTGRLGSKANKALSNGLIQMTEGHWSKAEKILTDHAAYSETPLLNYLAAARSAHMQEAYERRDDYLKQALESDSKATLAVGMTQADMQLTSGQLEQAHATLIRLRELAPKHPHVLKQLARTLYLQENWNDLLDILPELIKQNLLKSENMEKVQGATLDAMFQQYAKNKNLDTLQTLWKKLPSVVKENPEAIYLYSKALHQAGDDLTAANMINSYLSKIWDDQLADLYGRLQHHSLGNAIQQAEKWQASSSNPNPALLLLLARLYNQQKLWGMAKSCYEASLNQAPNSQAYLELAELLETMKEPENAQRCYRLGLRYCIRGDGEKLVLTPTMRPQNQQAQNLPLTPYNGL